MFATEGKLNILCTEYPFFPDCKKVTDECFNEENFVEILTVNWAILSVVFC